MGQWKGSFTRRAERDRALALEESKAKQRRNDHDSNYADVIEGLTKAGIDPDRLKEWLEGPANFF